MTGDGHKDTLRKFWDEVWNERRVEAAAEYLTEDMVLHVSGIEISGLANLGASLPSMWFDPFPDLRITLEQQVAEGDRVAESMTFTGTHSGTDFHPGLFRSRGLPPIPARGAPFEFTQMSISRFEGDRVAEIWEDFDRVRLFLQLGVELSVPVG
jgi:predicted ester cyclase